MQASHLLAFSSTLPPPIPKFPAGKSVHHTTTFPPIVAKIRGTGSSSSTTTDPHTEFDAVSRFSKIAPATALFSDLERVSPPLVSVTSNLILCICARTHSRFKGAFEKASADSYCLGLEDLTDQLCCLHTKALVNIGTQIANMIPGLISTEVDARLAFKTDSIVEKVHGLLKLYKELEVPGERLLFKIPSTWHGIEASKILESEGIHTHMTSVYSFVQVAAAAQAGASFIQIIFGSIKEWAGNNIGDPEIEASLRKGEDPALNLVKRAYNYIHKHGYKSKLVVASIWSKQELFDILGVDYVVVPLKLLKSLEESVVSSENKCSIVRKFSPDSAPAYNIQREEEEEEEMEWNHLSFSGKMGPAAVDLLTSGVDGYIDEARRVERIFRDWSPHKMNAS